MEIVKINFTCEFDKAYNTFTNLINHGYNIKMISALYKIFPYRVIDILLYHDNVNNLKAIKEYYNSLKIDDNRCLVISDTHIGRLSQNEEEEHYNICMDSHVHLFNEKGLYNAYSYAYKNNIKNIIHAGDLLEGASNIGASRVNANNQFKYLYKKYPNNKDIKTYILYGNHDYNLIRYNGYNDNYFNFNNNIEIIGVNYSYMSFCNNLVKISHFCSASKHYKNIQMPFNFELSGHSHVFSINEEERLIKVPSLSCTYSSLSDKGYLELINDENEYVFKFLDVDSKLKIEKTLSKKINNSYN